jgi:hypothetical protein
VNRPRAADDFVTIRGRMEELRREARSGPGSRRRTAVELALRSAKYGNGFQRETSTAPREVRQSAPVRTYVEIGIVDFGVSHSRSISALRWRPSFSAGSAAAIFASVSASMDRNATASGTRGRSR